MKSIKKTLIAAAVILFLAWCAFCEELMFWMVNETATVDSTPLAIFLVDYPEDDDHWSAVRIKVTSPDIGTQYLNNYLDMGPSWEIVTPAEEGVWLGDSGDGHISTGNWAVQASLALDGIGQELFEEALFSVELGYLTYDEMLDVVDWVTLAETDPVAKSVLDKYLYERGTLLPEPAFQWVPTTFYTAPEPSTSVLLALGASALLLKRKIG